MLARIAQELFWLGRDLTRAEHTARMLDGAFHADVAGRARRAAGVALSWEGCWLDPGEHAARPRRGRGGRRVAPRRGRALLTLDTDSPASVVSCVRARASAGARCAT